jgi:ABC-type nitrate/sulfonate/bicarbonate transport system substrate-binding protein
VAGGLFAEHGLVVEILEPAAGPKNVERVAAGGAEFCLTSLTHYLVARAERDDVPARFAATIFQRSPMAGIVGATSNLHAPADLAGRRIGGPPDSRLVAEYRAALASRQERDRIAAIPARSIGLPPRVFTTSEHGVVSVS